MKHRAGRPAWLLALLLAAGLLGGCAQRAPTSAAQDRAQASELRGATAFERGDLASAEAEYTVALRIHASLADTESRARTLLSLARVAAQAGQTRRALAMVNQVLSEPPLPASATRVVAHGRAAALLLGEAQLDEATRQLDQAATLCAGQCAQLASLTVLRARLALARRQNESALALSGDALKLTPAGSQPSAERANALRVQAQALLALGRHQEAADAATPALQIDQSLGLGARVALDLTLLAKAHRALGQADTARQYEVLATRARAAQGVLRGEPAEPQP